MSNKTIELSNRQKLERKIVRHLLKTAAAAGWMPKEVNDGGDSLVKCANVTEALDAVFSVDDSTVVFHKVLEGENKRIGVFIVLGNGIDCISDYNVNPVFEAEVMAASTTYVESLDV